MRKGLYRRNKEVGGGGEKIKKGEKGEDEFDDTGGMKG